MTQILQNQALLAHRVGRGSVRAGVGVSSTAQAELRPTAFLGRSKPFVYSPQRTWPRVLTWVSTLVSKASRFTRGRPSMPHCVHTGRANRGRFVHREGKAGRFCLRRGQSELRFEILICS